VGRVRVAVRAELTDAGALVQSHTGGDQPCPQAERKSRWLDVGSRPQRHASEERRRGAACHDLLAREWLCFFGCSDLAARFDELVPVAELRLACRDLERALGAVPRIDALLLAEGADPVHSALRGAADLDRLRVTNPVTEDRQVVPQR
jgi:hypothetical protein